MEAVGEIQVRVVKEEMIRPTSRWAMRNKKSREEKEASAGEEGTMFLTALDMLFRRIPHNRRVIFYDPPSPPKSHEEVVFTLKRSLGEVLDAFYPLAGRIVEPGAEGRLHLACNDEGAVFLEAVVIGGGGGDGDITLADLRNAGAFSNRQPPFFDHLVPRVHPPDYASAPPLIVQVSRFACGGIALGVAHSHVVCDGNSLWHFMVSWAECACGEPISLPPLHARTLLRLDAPSPDKARLMLDDDGNNSHDSEYLGTTTTATVDDDGAPAISMFRFTAATLGALKGTGTLLGEGRIWKHEYTSYETMCAHIWKHVTRAWGPHKPRNKMLSFISVVNMRGRVKPALGSAYFGNAVIWTNTAARASELEDESLADTARRIHDSIHLRADDDAFWGYLHWLELHGRDAVFRACMLHSTRVRSSSSHNFPVFKVDFGWGRPYVARCPGVEDAGKIIFFPGSTTHGDIDATLVLPPNVMQRLENDNAFTHP